VSVVTTETAKKHGYSDRFKEWGRWTGGVLGRSPLLALVAIFSTSRFFNFTI